MIAKTVYERAAGGFTPAIELKVGWNYVVRVYPMAEVQCEYEGVSGGHHILRSVNGGWRISFPKYLFDLGLAYEYFPNLRIRNGKSA